MTTRYDLTQQEEKRMIVQPLLTATRRTAFATVLFALSACAGAQSDASRTVVRQVPAQQPADAPVAPVVPPPAAIPNSTVAELQGLIKAHQVSELRTSYNGTYGASLLFKPDDLTFYVALFQQKDFWRVLKTSSDEQAEATYRAFANQSATLAQVDIERTKLQARNTHAERQLADRTAQLNSLQADQAVRRQQDQQVAARQVQSREEASALAAQQQDVSTQLRELQQQIDVLQAEQARVAEPKRKK